MTKETRAALTLVFLVLAAVMFVLPRYAPADDLSAKQADEPWVFWLNDSEFVASGPTVRILVYSAGPDTAGAGTYLAYNDSLGYWIWENATWGVWDMYYYTSAQTVKVLENKFIGGPVLMDTTLTRWQSIGDALWDSLAVYLKVFGTDRSLNRLLDGVMHEGVFDSSAVTNPSGLNLSFAAGTAYLDSTLVSWTGHSVAATNNVRNYAYVTPASYSTVQVSTTAPTGTYALIGVYDAHDGAFHHERTKPTLKYHVPAIQQNLDAMHNRLVSSGCLVALDPDGTNTNDFTVSAGSYFAAYDDLITIASTYYSSDVSRASEGAVMYYHVAGAWSHADTNGIDFAYWDNGTSRSTVSATKWYCGFVLGESADSVAIVYPQIEHDTEAAALQEAFIYPEDHEDFTAPLARFVMLGSATAFGADAYFADARALHGEGASPSEAQNLFATINAESGSETADRLLDGITIAGESANSTWVSNDTLFVGRLSPIANPDTSTYGFYTLSSGFGLPASFTAYKSGAIMDDIIRVFWIGVPPVIVGAGADRSVSLGASVSSTGTVLIYTNQTGEVMSPADVEVFFEVYMRP